jgi:hypothetical protein
MSLLLLVAAFCIYAAAFIYRTSFVIDGVRYFSLFDDAMVSMRYAKNLAAGYGLVWNPGGEHIEGYTNLLWVLWMAALHFLPVSAAKISLLVQLTGLAAVATTLIVIARLTAFLSAGSTLAIITACLLTAFYYPLVNWSLQGMEVSALALLVASAAYLALKSFEARRVSPWLYPLLALATLLRLDAVVPFLTILLVSVLADPGKRRQHLTLGLTTLAVAIGGQTAFRWWYYGDLLPNTYYLKMTGYPVLLRLARGAFVLAQSAVRLAIGLLLVLPALWFAPRDRRTALLGSLVLAQCAYSVYVGGDAWEWWGGLNRYCVIVMPLGFALLGIGLARFAGDRRGRQRVALVLVLCSVVTLNAASAIGGWRKWTLRELPLHVRENAEKVRLAIALRRITTPHATIAVVWAGAEPYMLGRPAIDLLGKSDRVIAHLPMRQAPATAAVGERLTYFWPGHLKYDYGYSIGRLRPDVVTELWHDPQEAAAWLHSAYRRVSVAGESVYVRRDSDEMRWLP